MEEEVPLEILEQIFRKTTPHDLTVLSSCSRRFAGLAQSLLFQCVCIDEKHSADWLVKLQQNPTLGTHVNRLTIILGSGIRVDPVQCAQIFPYFKKVREVTMHKLHWQDDALEDALISLLSQPTVRHIDATESSSFPLSKFCKAFRDVDPTPECMAFDQCEFRSLYTLHSPCLGEVICEERHSGKRLTPRSLLINHPKVEAERGDFWNSMSQFFDTRHVQELEISWPRTQRWVMSDWDFSQVSHLFIRALDYNAKFWDASYPCCTTWSPQKVTIEIISVACRPVAVACDIPHIMANFPATEEVEISVIAIQMLVENFPEDRIADIRAGLRSLRAPLTTFKFGLTIPQYRGNQDLLNWMDAQEEKWAAIIPARDDVAIDLGVYWYVEGRHLFPPRIHRRCVEIPAFIVPNNLTDAGAV